MNKRLYILLFLFSFAGTAFTQSPQISIVTDLSLMRSFKKEQRFWAIGQTIQTQFHFTPKDAAYVWISYYSNGEFDNKLTATAKSPSTTPQQISYVNSSVMKFQQFSMGWKKYLHGSYNIEYGWNLYGFVGFGLLFGKVENIFSTPIDTMLYTVPVQNGTGKFKRLTLDLGLGWEIPLGGSIYLYTEGKVWIPASDYPSKYILVNENAPLIGTLNLGIRILFD